MLERTRANFISKAYSKGFFVGFKWCKAMVSTYLLTPGAKLPRANPSDESLKVAVNNHVKMPAESDD